MQHRLIALVLAASSLHTSLAAQTLLRSVNGPVANAQFGKACLVVADQNGDSFKDVVVGAPGFNQERGAIYCLSGAYLASGAGTQILWTCAPTANQGDRFGTAVVDVGDATGDGIRDFLVGQPGHEGAVSIDRGAVRLVNGSSHAVVSTITGIANFDLMGTAIATTGDIDFDQRTEVLVGCPGNGSGTSRVYLFRNSVLATSGSAGSLNAGEVADVSGGELGTSLAAGFDYVNSGGFVSTWFVAGAPGANAPGAADAGKVVLGRIIFTGSVTITTSSYFSSVAGERLGTSVDATDDYDGDGVTDLVVGAPNAPNGTTYEVGRALVLSGARVQTQTSPYEIYTLPLGTPAPPVNHSDPDPNFHFGAAVRACGDLNNDGVGEILVGAPDFFTQAFPSGWSFRGFVRVYSGATGTEFVNLFGGSTDRLGDGLAGAIDDFDGDGFKEFVVAGSRSDAGGTDSGVAKCYRLFPVSPATYCAGKVNSLGCTPSIASSGTASESSGQPFLVTASNFLNQKNGLLFYSRAPTVVLFQGGMKCVANPTVRTPNVSSGGATSGSSCTGSYSFDFNAWIANGWDSSLAAGAQIFAQYWSRDPQSASHTSLSNALRFVIAP